jgi:hypothetical protein
LLLRAADAGDEGAAAALAFEFADKVGASQRLRYLEQAAALGVREAFEQLRRDSLARAKATGAPHDEADYWTLISAFDDDAKLQSFTSVLADSGWRALATALVKHSPAFRGCSRGCLPSGRSVECVAFADRVLRESTGFAGRVSFHDFTQDRGYPSIEQRLAEIRKAFASRTELCAPVLLAVEDDCSSSSGPCVSRRAFRNALLPRDELVIQYGSDSHQAMVWRVDDAKGEVSLLDPMSEFWRLFLPRDLDVAIDKYYTSRPIVRLSIDRLAPFVRFVIALRDTENPTVRTRLHTFPSADAAR